MSTSQNNVMEFADLARALGAAGEQSDRLMLAVNAAVELIPGCLHAGITINRDGECHTLAGHGRGPLAINVLQNELGEGPVPRPRPRRGDRRDQRPPGRRAVVGVGRSHQRRLPARVDDLDLRLHRARLLRHPEPLRATARAFDADDLATAQALAGHLAVALAAGREIEGMSAALQSRTVIGQAEGILMERLGVDSDQALAYLKRISSHTNTKLVQVAGDIVRTRQLPEA